MTELNTLGKQLQLTADTVTRDNIESSLVAVNKQWSDLTDLASDQQCQLSVSIRPSIHLSILFCFVHSDVYALFVGNVEYHLIYAILKRSPFV